MIENSVQNKISIIMGVYNCETTVIEAIQSIQAQTYSNWELIICDDGSSDNTYKIVEEYSLNDQRIKLIRNQQNSGLNKTLNNCLKLAGGEYIARMDGDDRCDSHRFEKQIEVLENFHEFAICGTAMSFFDQNGNWGSNTVPKFPTPEQVATGTPICHATVMIRKAALDSVGGYSEELNTLRVEDVDLWLRLYAKGYRCINIQEPLYYMRNDQNALNRRKYIYRINSTRTRLRGCRILNLGISSYIKAFKPMVFGLVPAKLRQVIRRHNYK